MTHRGGRYRIQVSKKPSAREAGTTPPRTFRYEGPFGPFEGEFGGRATVTRLHGPAVGQAELPWGPGTLITNNDLDERRRQEERLRQGITARIGDLEVRLHRPTRGFLRAHRAIWVERPDHPPARLRLRRYYALSLERADGTRLARTGGPLGMSGYRGVVTPHADAVDVALLLLADFAGLDSEVAL